MKPKEVLEKWIDCFNKADAYHIAELYATNAVNHQVANEHCILCAHVIPPVLVVRTCLKIHFCRTIAASEIITSNPEQDKLIF